MLRFISIRFNMKSSSIMGKLKYLNPCKGFGFIEPFKAIPLGDGKFYTKDIYFLLEDVKISGKFLNTGEDVTFELVRGKYDYFAMNVTPVVKSENSSFQKELEAILSDQPVPEIVDNSVNPITHGLKGENE